MIYEVRCCCNAGLVLGTIDLPAVDSPVVMRVPRLIEHYDPSAAPQIGTNDDATVEIARVWTSEEGLKLAVKSNERPIEFWRTLRGFKEAK